MLITPEYREQNRLLHEKSKDFGSGESPQVRAIAKMILEVGIMDVLDYGCGKGALAKYLPFPIREYDPAIPGKDTPPEPAEMVICRDVLEHIEPECIDDVLNDLGRVTKRFGYFVISHSPSEDWLPDGRNAHVLQRPNQWWREKLEGHFKILSFVTYRFFYNIIGRAGYHVGIESWIYIKTKS